MGLRKFVEDPPFWVRALLWICGLAGGFIGLAIGIWQISTRKTIPEFWADYGWQGVNANITQGIVFLLIGIAILVA